MTPDQLYLNGFAWGMGLGGLLGAVLVAIWYADVWPAGRRKRWLC